MKYTLPFLPERPDKPRTNGLTMMMDKGLSLKETEFFLESSGKYTDLVKFGFGTAIIAEKLKEKINLYKKGGVIPYFGGTLFELFIVRGLFDEFRKFVSDATIEHIEVSDGSIRLDHNLKLEYISKLSKDFIVISEVGYKVKGVELNTDSWVKNMQTEIDHGAWKVIAEARESGTIGIYNADGSANKDLITGITQNVPPDKVIWEAPNKNQQVYFITLLGGNVNLGNIASNEVVALEALRQGLRGDTFFNNLPDQFQNWKL